MNRGPITVRYAKGLFELGKEKNILDRLYNDSKLLRDHFLRIDEFSAFLNNPVIKVSQKKEVLQKTLKDEQHPLMLSFLNLVIEKNREPQLQDMIRFFEELYKTHKGIKSVKLITAVDIEENYKKELQLFLERELEAPLEIQFQTRKEILGGLILIVDGKIVDNSIAHQMKLIKKKLLS